MCVCMLQKTIQDLDSTSKVEKNWSGGLRVTKVFPVESQAELLLRGYRRSPWKIRSFVLHDWKSCLKFAQFCEFRARNSRRICYYACPRALFLPFPRMSVELGLGTHFTVTQGQCNARPTHFFTGPTLQKDWQRLGCITSKSSVAQAMRRKLSSIYNTHVYTVLHVLHFNRNIFCFVAHFKQILLHGRWLQVHVES